MEGMIVLPTMERLDSGALEILLAYFSATNNTRKIADRIAACLKGYDVSVTELDITSYENRQEQVSLDGYDAVVFGFPVYSLRAPRICREWLEGLDGSGKRCSVFFTFGGFGKDPAHYYIKKLLEGRGFTLVSTAEFPAAHTFNFSGWQAAEGHPNERDFEAADKFTRRTLKRFTGEDPGVVADFDEPEYSSEQLDMAEKFRFKVVSQLPTRNGGSCSMCGLCERLCPTRAMDAAGGAADPARCIACFRCIANCPDKVLHTNDISGTWEKKLEMHDTTKEAIDKMEGRIFL